MREQAETKAYLKIAAHALREAWPCDHNAHLVEPPDLDLMRCPGMGVDLAIRYAKGALNRLAREKEGQRRE